MEEVWKKIYNFPDYEISNQGNVISNKKGQRNPIIPGLHPKGYLFVKLCEKGVKKKFTIHKLVIDHFGGPQLPETTVDHINRIKTDNRICNLRWATLKEQTENSVKARQIGIRNPSAKLSELEVTEIKKLLSCGTSKSIIAKRFVISYTAVHYISTGKLWSHIKI